MIPILFNSNETAFLTNGLGRLTDCISCYVTEERNGPYTLEMVIATTTPLFNELAVGKTIAVTVSDGTRQAFDINEVSKPINHRVTIKANHISYRASYIPVAPFSATGITDTLEGLVENSLETCPFAFYTDFTNESSEYNRILPSSLRSCLGGSQGSVLDVFSGGGAGEYLWDNFTINFLLHRGSDKGASFRYGKNITDFNYTEDSSELVTGVLPYWANADQSLVYYGDIQYSENRSDYPTRTVVLDLSSEFEDAPSRSQLNSKAAEYITRTSNHLPKENITISFIDLARTGEQAVLETVGLCDTVTVHYEPLGITYQANVIKTTWNVLRERYEEIEIGEPKSSLSSTLEQTITDVAEVVSSNSMVSVVQYVDKENGIIMASVGRISEKVDNLAVGARNLWVGSKDFSVFSSLSGVITGETYEDNEILHGTEISQSSDLMTSLTLYQGKDYVLSFFAKGSGNVSVVWEKGYTGENYGITLNQKVLIFASSASVNASQSGDSLYINDETVSADDYVLNYGNDLQYIPLTNEWQLYVVKITTNSDFDLGERVLKIQGTDQFYLNSIMFEYGTVPTSWTPAPEDTETQIIEAQQATINITSSQILSTVSEQYASKDELESISSSVSQTAEDLRIEFNRDIGNLEHRVEANEDTVGKVNTYFKFSGENMQIGKDGSDMIMELDNDSLEFQANGTVVTWVDGKESVLGARELSLGEPGNNPRFRFLISRDGKHMRITRHS